MGPPKATSPRSRSKDRCEQDQALASRGCWATQGTWLSEQPCSHLHRGPMIPASCKAGRTQQDEVKTLASCPSYNRHPAHVQCEKDYCPSYPVSHLLKSAHSFVHSAGHTLLPLSKHLFIPKGPTLYPLLGEMFPQSSQLLLLTSLYSVHGVLSL